MKELGFWHSTIQEIYERPFDRKNGVEPLFRYEVKVYDIDTTRIKSIDRATVDFTESNPHAEGTKNKTLK